MTFLFDANFPSTLCEAFATLTARREHKFIPADAHLGVGAKDEAVIRAASEAGWFLVTLDQGISRNPAKRRALIAGGVGAFVFTGSAIGNLSFFKIAAFVLSIAEEMLDHASRTKRPFILAMSPEQRFKSNSEVCSHRPSARRQSAVR